MGTDRRRGQALVELAVGMFTLALVVSALATFAVYISKSLKMQNSLRTGSASQQDKVELSQFAAENVFGTSVLVVKEKVVMPNTEIPRLNDLELKTNLDL